MKMRCRELILAGLATCLLGVTPRAAADDQTKTGAGNSAAIALAKKSPMARSSYEFLLQQAERLEDNKLRKETLDALGNDATCVQHRANLSDTQKNALLQSLVTQRLLNLADAANIQGGAKAGVFPALVDEGTSCPKLPQKFFSAPGSASVFGHHSYPGGLVIHESNNDVADVHLADEYRQVYGHTGRKGFPTLDTDDLRSFSAPAGDALTSTFSSART